MSAQINEFQSVVLRRRHFLDVIRANFHGIHTTIPRIGAEEFVPLPDHPSVAIEYDKIDQMLKQGQV